jgi:DNA repair exonuclease SbcCD ATPase subunit
MKDAVDILNKRIAELEEDNERLGEQLTDSDCQLVDALAENERLREQSEEDANTFNQHHEEMLKEIERLKKGEKAADKEIERLRGENAMLLASADADAFNLNTLQRCCCRRGARMQKMYNAIQDCTYPDSMEKEFSAWFDEDGVPID